MSSGWNNLRCQTSPAQVPRHGKSCARSCGSVRSGVDDFV